MQQHTHSVNISHKRGLSEEQIRSILQATLYSESIGEDIGTQSDCEYIPPPCSLLVEGSYMKEVQLT